MMMLIVNMRALFQLPTNSATLLFLSSNSIKIELCSSLIGLRMRYMNLIANEGIYLNVSPVARKVIKF